MERESVVAAMRHAAQQSGNVRNIHQRVGERRRERAASAALRRTIAAEVEALILGAKI